MKFFNVVSTACLAIGVSFAGAFQNGSFDSPGGIPIYRPLGCNDGFLAGWINNASNCTGLQWYVSTGWPGVTLAGDGTHYVSFGNNGSHGGTLQQTFDTIAGQTYKVNYLINLENTLVGPQSMMVQAFDGVNPLGTAAANNFTNFAWANGPALTFTAASTSTTLIFTDTTPPNLVEGQNWDLDGVTVTLLNAPSAAPPDLLVGSPTDNSIRRFDGTTGAYLGYFVTPGAGGLSVPTSFIFGPDGNLYVSSNAYGNGSVKRYNGTTGAYIDDFVPQGSGGIYNPYGLVFGPDGNFYVAVSLSAPGGAKIARYNGMTGAYIDDFVPPGVGGIYYPEGLVFGPDGNLYVSDLGVGHGVILRYNGATGAPIDVFTHAEITPGSLTFGSDGNLYVSLFYGHFIERYNGSTGADMGNFVSTGSGGLYWDAEIGFGPDGDLYETERYSGAVKRYNGTTGAYINDFATGISGEVLSLRWFPAPSAAPPADTTGPVITPTITGTQGANGWYVGDVTVTWSVTDAESGVTSSSGCAASQLSASASLLCTAVNGANLNASYPLHLRIDKTPPVISAPAITGTLGANGWYTSGVTLSWSTSDPESGIVTPACGTTVNGDTAGTTFVCNATNAAGLFSSSSVTIKIDKTPLVISGMPALGCSLWPPNGKMVRVATVTAADALSGLAPGSFQVTGTSNEPPSAPEILITPNGTGGYIVQLQADRLGKGTGRVYTLTATAGDLAGNTATVTATCTVPHDQGKEGDSPK